MGRRISSDVQPRCLRPAEAPDFSEEASTLFQRQRVQGWGTHTRIRRLLRVRSSTISRTTRIRTVFSFKPIWAGEAAGIHMQTSWLVSLGKYQETKFPATSTTRDTIRSSSFGMDSWKVSRRLTDGYWHAVFPSGSLV